MSNVTPIRPGANAPVQPDLIPAIEEQAAKAWQLRNLIQCVREALSTSACAPIEDPDAAMDGLVELADEISTALQSDALTERAAKIAEDNTRAAAVEARHKAIEEQEEDET